MRNDEAIRGRSFRGLLTTIRNGASAGLAGLVLAFVLTGCASLVHEELKPSDPHETALQRSTRHLLQEFTAYPIGLERTWDRFSTGLSEDFESTRDTVVGLPGSIADDVRDGWEASTGQIARIGTQAARDARELPHNFRRLWKLIQ